MEKRILKIILPLLLLLLSACASNQANKNQPYIAADTSRTVDLTHPPRDMWDRIRRGFAIPNLQSEKVDYWTDYYASHPQSVLLMSQRAGKYLYYIVEELNQRGLPTELALLPFVESAYNPNALSRSKASGLWQFIPSTGKYYNLEQDWWRDQRRDPVASTKAALDYLSYLYDFQGDWYLALASYNWGEGATKRAMKKVENKGKLALYTELDMPEETLNYVPKLQAIKNIIARPDKYGLTLPNVSNTPYFTTVHKTDDMDVAVAAALAEMPLEEFQALNPSYNQPLISSKYNTVLHLPLDKVEKFNLNLAKYSGQLASWQVYHPKRGQSLAAIAKDNNITLTELRQANNLSPRQTQAGTNSLLIPIPAKQEGLRLKSYSPDAQLASIDDIISKNNDIVIKQHKAQVISQTSTITHTIRRGDTLYSLARRYKTSVDTIRKLNKMSGSRLSTGKKIKVPKIAAKI